MKKNKTIKYIVGLIVLSAITIVILDHLNMSSQWIKKNVPIQSKILILERWMPANHFEEVVKEYNKYPYEKLIITGKTPFEGIPFYKNNSLVIKNFPQKLNRSKDRISIRLIGSNAKKEYSICKVMLNDEVIFNDEIIKEQKIVFNHSVHKGDSITIAFVNDAVEGNRDRNLMIKRITINREKLNIFANGNYITKGAGKKKYYFNNLKDLTAFRLTLEGIPKEKIVSLNARQYGFSRTYNNALAVHQWINDNGYKTANIITLSYHSRRTFLSFKKANPEIKFGVKTIDAHSSKARTLKEIVGNFFIRVTPKFILDLPNEND